MSSENGIDYAKEIWLGQADDYEGNPEDIEGNGSVLWSQANNFEANGQRYVRADIHEDIRKKKEELEASFREGMKEVEDTYHGELVAQDKTIAALRAQLSDLTRERPMSEAPKEEGWYPVDEGENRSVAYWDDEDKQWLSAIALSPNCAYISWSYALPLPATGGTET